MKYFGLFPPVEGCFEDGSKLWAPIKYSELLDGFL
jgi:hypothetical protein